MHSDKMKVKFARILRKIGVPEDIVIDKFQKIVPDIKDRLLKLEKKEFFRKKRKLDELDPSKLKNGFSSLQIEPTH